MPKIRLIALVLLLAPAAAHAGLRATYDGAEPGRTIVVEVADNGDARVGEPDRPDYGVLAGGRFYVVGSDRGRPTVARVDDIAVAADRVVPPMLKSMLGALAGGYADLRTVARGPQTIAGRAGIAYDVYGADPADRAAPQRFVMSRDPELAPVGRALGGFVKAALLPGAVLLGPVAQDISRQMDTLFALGAPLAAQGRFTLRSVVTADVPAARLALPATPLTVDQLAQRMRAMLPR